MLLLFQQMLDDIGMKSFNVKIFHLIYASDNPQQILQILVMDNNLQFRVHVTCHFDICKVQFVSLT